MKKVLFIMDKVLKRTMLVARCGLAISTTRVVPEWENRAVVRKARCLPGAILHRALCHVSRIVHGAPIETLNSRVYSLAGTSESLSPPYIHATDQDG